MNSPIIALLISTSPLAHADVPMGIYPDCGEADRPDLCPADLGESWDLVSYVRDDWLETVRPEEHALGTGLWADRAWRMTTGRTDVVIAVLDSGIKWDDSNVLHKHWLNADELPLPQDADGVEADDYDANGDGVFNISDYADDPRVAVDAGEDVADTILDPSDLIATFSDGVDDDDNGYTDDIAGWDFMWNDNNPYDDTRYGHGTGEAKDSTAEGDDSGGSIGTCPSCMVLNLRVSDSFLADAQSFGSAVLYATDRGASVVQEALGSVNNSAYVRDAIEYAWDNGVLVVASAADESAYHHNMPGSNPRTLYVHANRHDDEDEDQSESFLAYGNCTNHGPRLVLSAPSTSCSSGATGVTSGVAGLVYSAAREVGIELTAGEAWQLLAMSADDIDLSGDPELDEAEPRWYPSKPGWDRYFGYGRINAERAVAHAMAGEIPPEADFDSPEWFQMLDPVATPQVDIEGSVHADRAAVASWSLQVGLGDEPDDFTEVASGTDEIDGVLGTLDIASLGVDAETPLPTWPVDWDQVERETALAQYTITLRLQVTDTLGNTAEKRRAVYVQSDPDWHEGTPIRLDSSIEASPLLVDLDGDGVQDIVQGDGNGWIHAWSMVDGPAEIAGWPVQTRPLEELDPEATGNHLDAPAYTQVDPSAAASIVASPAAGDLDGDGTVEIVVATFRGDLYVYEADGSVRAGFPVSQDTVDSTDPDHLLDEGFFSSPALGDLDGDGDLEIVIGGMDQQVYAWQDDGSMLSGWPVTPQHSSLEGTGTRVISSPALGDLNGDGRDDVVIGTNEIVGELYGVAYALDGQGAEAEGGAVMPGWPVKLFGASVDALPMVGEGVPASPALADLDGDGQLEIAIHTIGGPVDVLEPDGSLRFETPTAFGSYGADSNVDNASVFPFINSSSWGDLDSDGTPDLVTGGIGSGLAEAMLRGGLRMRIDYGQLAWSGATGEMFPAWPRALEDMQFFMDPAIADIDGDRKPEVIVGTSGHVLHAFDVDGVEPEGWPKFTGQWMIASPSVGDVDGDGLLEVVIGTRAGVLYVWDTPSPAGATVSWASFGHDNRNTANHEAPLDGYNGGYPDVTKPEDEGGCGCAAGGRLGGLLLAGLALGLVVVRREL